MVLGGVPGRLVTGVAIACVVWGMQLTGVAAALPTIASELGPARLYGWIPTGFMLAEALGAPLIAWLADRWGRRRTVVASLVVFGLGSAASAAATSMPQLVAFAVVQGLCAGGCYATLLAALVEPGAPAARIGRVQGVVLAAYGLGQLAGPVVAEAAIGLGSWRYLFAISVPLTLVAAPLVTGGLRDHPRGGATLDVAGLGALGALGALLGAGAAGWLPDLIVYAGAVAILAAGWWIERRAAQPLVPRSVLADRRLVAITVVLVAGEALAFCVLSFLPLFVAQAYGSTALAGRVLVPAILGRTLASLASGPLMRRVSTRWLPATGLGMICASVAALRLFGEGVLALPALAITMFVLGAGLGVAYTPLLVAIQRRVPGDELAGATAFETFMSAVGSTIAAGLASTVLGDLLGAGAALPDGHTGGPGGGFGWFWGLLAVLAAVAVGGLAAVRGQLDDPRCSSHAA